MSAGRALRRPWPRPRPRGPAEADLRSPPVFWGRIGTYDAVCRDGMLLLLSPEPGHPSRRVTNDA